MTGLPADFRYGLRQLRNSPGSTAVALLTLALGLGANTAVFTVVHGVLLRPMPFPEPERLFLLSSTSRHGPFETGPSLSDGEYLNLRQRDRLFESMASFDALRSNLTGIGDPVQVPAASVTPEFVKTLRVAANIGRSFLPGEDQKGRDAVVVLSRRLWIERFGADSHVLGRRIKLDGVERTVIGVMPPGFNFPFEAELWTPLRVEMDPHNSFARPVVGRLRAGVSRRQAQTELETFARQWAALRGEGGTDRLVQVIPLKELLVGNVRQSLLVFAGAVAFVLLIACANVANLSLARASGRVQELAVRTSLGAGRGRLARQVLVETTILSLIGAAVGLLIARWSIAALLSLAPAAKIPRSEMIQVDQSVLAFTVVVAVIVGIASGLIPALRVVQGNVHELLHGSKRTTTERHQAARYSLVVFRIALAMILLTGAGLMLKSYFRLRQVNPGFRPDNTLTMTVDLPDSTYRTVPQLRSFDTRVLSGLSRLPGVLSAGAVNWRPLGELLVRGDFQIEGGQALPPGFLVDKPCVSSGYFQAMGIRLLAGRSFSERDDERAPGVAIVSRALARGLWPGQSAIGKRISMEDHPRPGDWLTIIGVVDDVKQQGLNQAPDPAVYQPYLQVTHPFFLNHMTFVVRTASSPEALASEITSVVRGVDKDQPVQSVASMETLISASTTEPRFQARLLAVFACVALALAMVGVYGVLAYAVAERTNEIGVRLALGAQRGDLFRMLLGNALVLAAAGIVSGTAGALALTRLLRKFLFEVQPHDPLTFAVVIVTLFCTALAAGTIPARWATKVEPLVALRYE